MERILFFLIVPWALSACAGPIASNSTLQPIPTPASSLVRSFVWQTDGLCGYRMLRPANWESPEPGDGRDYGSPGFQDKADRIMLRAINLQAYYQSAKSLNGLNVTLFLFEKDSSLEGWTMGIEQNWKSNGLEFTLLRTLPQAKIYLVKSPGSSDVQLVAFAVDKNQPLAIELTAAGAYADLERLKQAGIADDFATIVASAQAIPQDPQNADPSLADQR